MDQEAASDRQALELFQAAELLLEECRMVLPGVQGLFGFQLVAVFSPAFSKALSAGEQSLHLLAIALVAVAIVLIMTPAATHRQMNPCEVTLSFIRLGARLLLWTMVPMAIALCIDFYLVARVITGARWVAWLAVAMGAFILLLWGVLPRVMRHREAAAGRERGT